MNALIIYIYFLGIPSGVGVSLLPGAPPTMVSVPSVIDSLPVITSYSSSLLSSLKGKTSASKDSSSTINSNSTVKKLKSFTSNENISNGKSSTGEINYSEANPANQENTVDLNVKCKNVICYIFDF